MLKKEALHGVLPIYKPKGITSTDVTRKLKPFLRKQKIGHVGTLDPLAEGVLPIVLGRACRLQDFMLDLPKTYECEVKLGQETTTLDAEGGVIACCPYQHVSLPALQKAAKSMLGQQVQTPPLYSAIKHKGKKLYQYAREHGSSSVVDLKKLQRKIYIYKIEIAEHQEDLLKFTTTVSKGTYIRTLALDLAKKVSTLGYLTKLVRKESSGIHDKETFSLCTITNALMKGEKLEQYLISLSALDLKLPQIKVHPSQIVNDLIIGKIITTTVEDLPKNFSMNRPLHTLSFPKEDILMTNACGNVFGLGSIRSIKSSDSINIHMHRSLL